MGHELTITGASDDLVEIGGDFSEEIGWYWRDDDEEVFLAVSDGTLLSVTYDGIWRFALVSKGRAEVSKVDGVTDEDTNDVVTLRSSEPFKYVLLGRKLVRR
jgi:hypothetical protein